MSDVTEAAGISFRHTDGSSGRRYIVETVTAGLALFDYDGDGDIDVYFLNGAPTLGCRVDEPPRNALYRNEGNFRFRDVTDEANVGDTGYGLGVAVADYDNDGDTDIAVLNDVRGNFLFENDGSGKFREIGLMAGIAYSTDGMTLGSMGIDCGDYNNDGWLDLFQTAYSSELPALYRNTGIGFFEDVTRAAGAGTKTFPHVNWGTGFVDFHNDGDRDLFIANGHLQDNVEQYSDSTAFEVANTLLVNTGDGKFVDVSKECGDGLLPELSSRGTGFDDLDDDGDVDVVILNSRREPTILRNDTQSGNHWIQIRLQGTTSNRDGVGANVKVTAGDLVQLDEVHSGRGYQSHHGARLHFGLGKRDRVDRIEVRWIGGGTDVVEDVAVDQLLTIVEAERAE